MTITGWEAVTLAAITVPAFGALYLHARRDYEKRSRARRSEHDGDH